ncbi:MreB/Mrl family cell shape determining protein [Candidatus Dojkabacteria bacterium]|nr:MreB/Mrl family cell shape determining protein [Candidatus Dojkabacteria bacterium]
MKNYFDRFLEKITYDIGIDLGTANTLVALKNFGIVIHEPSVVAVNKNTNEVLAVGLEARHMIGRTPSYITSVSPLRDGIITDFDITEAMVRYFLNKVHRDFPKFFNISRPRLVIGVPSKITEVEVKAVVDAGISAGARKVYIIEEPMAAAIGTKLPIENATGNMIVDIGGGTTDIAVISLGGIIVDNTIKIAGNEMDEAIVNYIRNKYNLLIGVKMAEDIKIELGSAIPQKKEETIEVKGRDLVTGLPKVIKFTSVEVREAIMGEIEKITEAIKEAIEKTPPEIISDLLEKGIILTGGGSLIRGLDKFLEKRLKLPVLTVEDPMASVAKGTEILLDEIDLLEKVKVEHNDII